jgi:hypothetical protein
MKLRRVQDQPQTAAATTATQGPAPARTTRERRGKRRQHTTEKVRKTVQETSLGPQASFFSYFISLLLTKLFSTSSTTTTQLRPTPRANDGDDHATHTHHHCCTTDHHNNNNRHVQHPTRAWHQRRGGQQGSDKGGRCRQWRQRCTTREEHKKGHKR